MIENRQLQVLVATVPIAALIPSVTTPLGTYRPAVEIAHYFQALALLRDGLQSYTYLTPAESSGGLHIHSLLSTPLLAAGVRPAGRIVSVIAAAAAVLMLIMLVSRLMSPATGLLAGVFLWAHPLFLRFSSTWVPYILSVSLTIGALLGAVLWVTTQQRRWYVVSLGILSVGIFNHTWEASIMLPIAVLYANRGYYREIAGVVVTTIISLLIFVGVRSLQPRGHDLTQSYSLLHQTEALFSVDWFFHGGFEVWRTWWYFKVLTVPVTLFAIACVGVIYFQTRREDALVIGAWLLSGLSILVLLPRGWMGHGYYAWGVLAPLATVVAWGCRSALDVLAHRVGNSSVMLRVDGGSRRIDYMTFAVVIVLLISSMGYAVTTQAKQLDTNRVPEEGSKTTWGHGHPKQAAGAQLAASNISNPEEIVFIGPWGRSDAPNRLFTKSSDVGRVLIYSNLLVRSRSLDQPGTPRFANSSSNMTECKRMVIADPANHTVHVQPC